jgi:glutamyl-tRNA synthetase
MANPAHPDDPAARDHLSQGREVLRDLAARLALLDPWTAPQISATLKAYAAEGKLKMPQVMMPFRVALTGLVQTPAIDAIAAALDRKVVLERLEKALAS